MLQVNQLVGFGVVAEGARIITIATDAYNVNLRALHDALYPTPDANTVVECVIESGVIVGSTSNANPSFDVGTWPDGATLSLVLEGNIRGAGGDGGGSANDDGQPGGTAFYTRVSIAVDGTGGTIYGGGGGGGAGAGSGDDGGGGGGAGRNPGAGGDDDVDGSDGTLSAGGSGASGTGVRSGGKGGNPGQAGNNGENNSNSGGAAGNAIDGDSFVTFTVEPSILGPRVN